MTRPTYADYLIEHGREDELEVDVRCRCGRVYKPVGLLDVRAYAQLEGAFRCEAVCASEICRLEQVAEEEAARVSSWPTEEDLAGIRAERDLRLQKSDWTQLPDNQTRLGPEKLAEWNAYREAVRAVLVSARDDYEKVDWPDPPD